MNILYWVCFVFIILKAIVYFYNILKKGLPNCYTARQKIGVFCGYVIGIACWIGVIYFYLH